MAKKPINQNKEILALFSQDDIAVLRGIKRLGEARVQKLIAFHQQFFPQKPKRLSKKERQLLSQANLFNQVFPDFCFQEKRGPKKKIK